MRLAGQPRPWLRLEIDDETDGHSAVRWPLAAFARADRRLSGKVSSDGSLPEGRGVGYPDLPRLRRQGAAGGPDLLPVWR